MVKVYEPSSAFRQRASEPQVLVHGDVGGSRTDIDIAALEQSGRVMFAEGIAQGFAPLAERDARALFECSTFRLRDCVRMW